jgi:hypothetical protein
MTAKGLTRRMGPLSSIMQVGNLVNLSDHTGPDHFRAVSEPFLEPFLGIAAILDRFSLIRAMGDPLNTPCVPSDGVIEARSTQFGRPRPWVGLGEGISLKISRAPRHTPRVDW